MEETIDVEEYTQQEFYEIAEHFRTATEPDEVGLLGDRLGSMVFGG